MNVVKPFTPTGAGKLYESLPVSYHSTCVCWPVLPSIFDANRHDDRYDDIVYSISAVTLEPYVWSCRQQVR